MDAADPTRHRADHGAVEEPRLARKGSVASLLSTASKTSRKSRDSLSSVASRLFRFRSSSRSSRSTASSNNSTEKEVSVGDSCETASLVTVRSGEALDSQIVGELTIGTRLEIVEVGQCPRRARVVSGTLAGWISVHTKDNYPLITKASQDSIASFEVGGRHQVLSLITLRKGENLDSPMICDLVPGMIVTIAALGQNNHRARVLTAAGEGWISVSTCRGQPLVGKIHDTKVSQGHWLFSGSRRDRSKTFLESARCGDLECLKKALSSSISSNVLGRVDVNCSDVRGKTALIFAAAFGHRDIVEYLLFQRLEVDVNATDDTKKTALHHVARRARNHPRPLPEEQLALLQSFLDCGASIEAKDHNGCTALMFAVAFGDEAVAQALIDARANVSAQDHEGHTPLDYANIFGHCNLIQMLRNAGASPGLGESDSDWSQSASEGTETESHQSLDALFQDIGPGCGTSSSSRSMPSLPPDNGSGDKVKTRSKPKAKAKTRAKVKARPKPKAMPDGAMKSMIADLVDGNVAKMITDHRAGHVEVADCMDEVALKNEVKHQDCKAGVVSNSIVGAPKHDIGASSAIDCKGSSKVVTKDGPVCSGAPKKRRSSIKTCPDQDSNKAEDTFRPPARKEGKSRLVAKRASSRAMVDPAKAVAEDPVGDGIACQACPIKGNMRPRSLPEAAEDAAIRISTKEEAYQKEKATLKLLGVTANSASATELEEAIDAAALAGADADALQRARTMADGFKRKESVFDRLRVATEQADSQALSDAIAEAETSGFSEAELEFAREALRLQEGQREKAKAMLQEAQNSGDVVKLNIAIGWAQKAKLPSHEIVAVEKLLLEKESSLKEALAALKAALGSRDVDQLKNALEQAHDVGVDDDLVDAAERMLQEEEPKFRARLAILEAVETVPVDTSAIHAAIQQGKDAKLDASEYVECEDILRSEALKEQALAGVRNALASCKNVSMTSLDELSVARDLIGGAIHAARGVKAREADLKEADLRRRKLHNAIEDLKGSIRVFCRIRPLSAKEQADGDKSIVRQLDGMTAAIADGASELPFAFDAVFSPGTQEEVFEDCRELVQSAVDGYNVTIFAYGQTGAGKTYTMGGSKENPGLSQRTINELFRVLGQANERCQCTVTASVLELYRHDMRDLLVSGKSEASSRKLQIRSEGVEGLLEQECQNPEELARVLEDATRARKTVATAMNSDSSRSHLLFTIKITSVNRETKETIQGKIMIVDLAGSERLSKSQVTGDEAKEAIEINKSLTALGDVMEALTKGQKQIPYRNNKLTMIMQDAIGGSAKTLMFVNCSPAASNLEETVNAMKYATRAKKVTNSSAKRRISQAS